MIALFNRLEMPFQNTQRNTEEIPRRCRNPVQRASFHVRIRGSEGYEGVVQRVVHTFGPSGANQSV